MGKADRVLGTNLKLQKQLSRKVGEKEYSKYVITISPKQIEKLGWREGQDLAGKIRQGKLIITVSRENEEHE
jgi:formylmethanofuran dehydrogenase subunit D